MFNFIINTGDELRIRSNLRAGMEILHGVNDDMESLRGSIVTVGSVSGNRIFLRDNVFTWSRDMFEEIIKGTKNEQEVQDTRDCIDFKMGDIVKIRKAHELKEIYGEDENGIKTYIPFTKEMEKICGEIAVVKSIFGRFVKLKFISPKFRQEHINAEWNFSTDMIEIKKEKEKGVTIKMTENNEDIINEMISKVDVKKFKKILASSFEIPATKLLGVDKILRCWAESKKDLYVLFGNSLKISKKIEYSADATVWNEQLELLCEQFPGIGYMLHDIPVDCFMTNTYIHFSNYTSQIMNTKEGTKLTTFLSNAFKNEEFDTALSKVIEQAKVKGCIVISIDPVDFLTMSFNQSGWCSCHTISHKGRSKDFGEYVRRYIQLHNRRKYSYII